MPATSVIFLCLCNFHIISRRAFSCGRLGGPRVRMSDTIHIPFIPHLSFYISSLCVFCGFCCCFVLPFFSFFETKFHCSIGACPWASSCIPCWPETHGVSTSASFMLVWSHVPLLPGNGNYYCRSKVQV